MSNEDSGELEEMLIKAAEHCGEPRQVSSEIWKEMLQRQFLGVASSISVSQMEGVMTPEQESQERLVNNIRKQGLRDGLAGNPPAFNEQNYLIGYNLGKEYHDRGDDLSKPENIELYL
jgi:hypothetical protein